MNQHESHLQVILTLLYNMKNNKVNLQTQYLDCWRCNFVYEPSCPSVGWFVSPSVINSLKSGKLHFHASIRALVSYNFFLSSLAEVARTQG